MDVELGHYVKSSEVPAFLCYTGDMGEGVARGCQWVCQGWRCGLMMIQACRVRGVKTCLGISETSS